MRAYTNVLMAVDLSPGTEHLMERAAELARFYQARLSVVHVVEYLPMTMDNEFIMPMSLEMQESLLENARIQLGGLLANKGLDDVSKFVELGSAKLEILRLIDEQSIDLVVLGAHGRHGIARVLGSTANAVIHASACDVLVVRMQA